MVATAVNAAKDHKISFKARLLAFTAINNAHTICMEGMQLQGTSADATPWLLSK